MKHKAITIIKACFLIVIFSCDSNSDKVKDDIILLNKVVELTLDSNDDSYLLTKNVNSSKEKLKGYYNYRFFNKPFFTIMKGYDKEKDSVTYDNIERQKKRDSLWKIKTSVIDNSFSKKDIERFLQRPDTTKWDSDKLSNNVNLIKKGGHYISRPYYSSDKVYALIQHYTLKTQTTFFIFKKESGRWIEAGRIENAWF